MERDEITKHEVKVYRVISQNPEKWFSNQEIADRLNGVSGRTIRLHTKRFVQLGLVDLAEVFPRHKYRWSAKADKRNYSYLSRLKQADEVFGNEIQIKNPN